MVRVKICGLTRFEDAAVALELGADYLGFILYPPSPRSVTSESVGYIVDELRRAYPSRFIEPNPPQMIGVFVNETSANMAKIMDRCGLDIAQLSGDEDGGSVNNSGSPILGRAYKAIRPRSSNEAIDSVIRYANSTTSSVASIPSILLDTPHGHLYGGSGEVGNWGLAAELAAGIPRLMLAGGLTPDNVSEAVRKVRPFAVDVASGVESSPGIKDHNLICLFIQNAKYPRQPEH